MTQRRGAVLTIVAAAFATLAAAALASAHPAAPGAQSAAMKVSVTFSRGPLSVRHLVGPGTFALTHGTSAPAGAPAGPRAITAGGWQFDLVDARGFGTGYHVQVSRTAFTGRRAGRTVTLGGASLSADTWQGGVTMAATSSTAPALRRLQGVDNGRALLPIATVPTTILTTAATNGHGMGTATVRPGDLHLHGLADAPAGWYAATVTLDVWSGPDDGWVQ